MTIYINGRAQPDVTSGGGGGGSGGVPASGNKNIVALATSAPFDQAIASGLAATPIDNGYVTVSLNGVSQTLGNGVRTQDFYFSADGGTTARAYADITAGDTLHVGSGLGVNLSTSDRIDIDYDV